MPSLNSRKTLGMSENTEFLGSVVANWLQNIVASLLPEWVEYIFRNAAEESVAFVVGKWYHGINKISVLEWGYM